MKIKKYIMLLSSALIVAACNLDMIPEGATMTEEQKDANIQNIPERLAGDVNALKDGLIVYGTLGSKDNHFDYGFPAVCLMYDQGGQDMVAQISGYNWFSSSLQFMDRLPTSTFNTFMWELYYNHIKSANDCINYVNRYFPNEEDQSATVKNYLGQALASRAFDYLQLAQTYQFTYIGHENEKCVPLVLETMTEEELNNNPRATVQAVYDRIMKDLNNAIDYLENNRIARADKAQITAEVAYGLRARANLLMGNWADAATDAASALSGGNNPYSIEEVSVPAFNSTDANSWIWGAVITAQSDVVKTSIVNWPSHLCSLTGMGYTTSTDGTAYRLINAELWSKIPASDVRKGWWVDGRLQSPILINRYGRDDGSIIGKVLSYSPYTNVKFGEEGNGVLNTENSQDWPMMRAEEMCLIMAEATARSEQAIGNAKRILENFVQLYRDESYTCTATTLDEFLDEIWFQRRIELWGEGFSLFDILRFKKSIVRLNANFAANCTYADITPESAIMIYRIPEREISVNQGIGDEDNNASAMPPTPVGQ